MPRQQAPYATRTSVEQMNRSVEQVAQFYETAGDRNSAFGTEDIPSGLITHLASPPSEAVRWSRHDGDAWIAAMLPPTINCGWTSNLVVADRTDTMKLTATIRLNEPVPAGKTYTVSYKTTDGTATAAENDFTAIPLTSVTFAEGERERTVEVSVTGKGTTPQPPEQFYLDLSSPSEGSATFGIGSRLTISLTGDTSLLVLSLADARCDEGQAASVVASINREATGDVAFQWSTRQQASVINRAPASLYTAVASVPATIPEGALSTNLVVQTVEVNAQTQVRNQNFEVIVPQASLMVDGGDAFAATGHDLVSVVTVARNQYVPPNVVVQLEPQYVSRNAFYAAIGWAFYDSNDDDYELTFPNGYITRRDDRNTWRELPIYGRLSTGNQLEGAHFFISVSNMYVSDDSTTSWFLLQPRTARIDLRVSPSIVIWNTSVFYLPQPSDGSDPFYSKATYEDLTLRFQNPLYTLTVERASGVRAPSPASRTYNWPAS